MVAYNKITLCFLILLLNFPAFSQDAEDNFQKRIRERIFFGGEIGLQFGTMTFINLSPLVGYKITDRLSAGGGPKFIFYKYNDKQNAYSSSMYGGRVFGRYNLTQSLFAHAEYEVLNLETHLMRRENVESIFVGGGFRQRMGQHSYLLVTVLWNINQTVDSPYINPVIRMEFLFGR